MQKRKRQQNPDPVQDQFRHRGVQAVDHLPGNIFLTILFHFRNPTDKRSNYRVGNTNIKSIFFIVKFSEGINLIRGVTLIITSKKEAAC